MRILLSSLVAFFLIATPASAQMIEKLTAENVGATLTNVGLRYIASTDNRGHPVLQVDGTPFGAVGFNVLFYSCDDNGQCDDITLWSWYNADRLTMDQSMHIWNDVLRESRNWSRAYVDQDGDPVLAMNINATGGIGSHNLQIMVNTYITEAQEYRSLVGQN